MHALPYLEQFVATRVRVLDLAKVPNLAGVATDAPGFVYCGRFWIECETDGSFYLPLASYEHTSRDLAELEGLLFEYAVQHEALDEEECHLSCVSNQLPCPKVCRLCGGAS